MTTPVPGHAWADIDLDALVANASAFAARTGRGLLPLVKANAYGLGAIAVARALEAVAPWGYGVATVPEGRELRAAGITRPILVLTPLTGPAAVATREADLRPSIADAEGVRAWLGPGAGAGAGATPFHVEVDTGLSRTGFRWDVPLGTAEAGALREAARAGTWEGIFTHLHSAEAADGSAAVQRRRLAEWLERVGARPAAVHVASSAGGVMGIDPEETLVRPGIFLYGGVVAGQRGRQVVRLRAPVVAVRRLAAGDTVSYDATWRAAHPTTVATIGAGYADGIPRSLSNRGRVELGDRVVPMVGTVAMDYVMVDVGNADVAPGDVATIYGGRVSLDDQATLAGTIAYELLTGLGGRVPRLYSGAAAAAVAADSPSPPQP